MVYVVDSLGLSEYVVDSLCLKHKDCAKTFEKGGEKSVANFNKEAKRN